MQSGGGAEVARRWRGGGAEVRIIPHKKKPEAVSHERWHRLRKPLSNNFVEETTRYIFLSQRGRRNYSTQRA